MIDYIKNYFSFCISEKCVLAFCDRAVFPHFPTSTVCPSHPGLHVTALGPRRSLCSSEQVARWRLCASGENQWFPRCLRCELGVLLLFILFSRCGTLPSPLEKKSLALQEPYQMPRLGNLLRSALHPVFSPQAELITAFPLLPFAFDGCLSVCLARP